MADKLMLAADGVAAAPFQIPGATGEFRIQLLNEDAAAGVVTSIVHLPPGGRIPAHRHQAGPEMHYVLEGDMIEAGHTLGPGSFLTHAPGVVHGPHESRGGARVLTVQQWQPAGGSFDFEPVDEGQPARPPVDEGQPARPPVGEGQPARPPVGEGQPAPPDEQRSATEEGLGKGYG